MREEGEWSYDVRIYSVDRRPGARGDRYRLRWKVQQRIHTETYATGALADSRRAELVSASRRGEPFDTEHGLPARLIQKAPEISWWQWILRYTELKWPDLAPTSRKSLVEALVDATCALIAGQAAPVPEAAIRRLMYSWALLPPVRGSRACPDEILPALIWVESNSPTMTHLVRPGVLVELLDSLSRRQDGSRAAPTTVARKRTVLFNVLALAAEYGVLDSNPLVNMRRRSPKVNSALDPVATIDPARARALINAVELDEPWGPRLITFFGCMYYAAMRPSEVMGLSEGDIRLEGSGRWGELLLRAGDPEVAGRWSDGGARRPKGLKHRARGAVRPVPCAPPLVGLLQAHVERFTIGQNQPLFRGPKGGRIDSHIYASVWERTRRRVLTEAEVASPLVRRPYDLRHSAVSTWLAAGVDSALIAQWAGHSVAVLHSTYVHVLKDRDEAALRKIEQLLADF